MKLFVPDGSVIEIAVRPAFGQSAPPLPSEAQPAPTETLAPEPVSLTPKLPPPSSLRAIALSRPSPTIVRVAPATETEVLADAAGAASQRQRNNHEGHEPLRLQHFSRLPSPLKCYRRPTGAGYRF